MSRAPKPSKNSKKAPGHSNFQIKHYLVKRRRKPTGDNPPNKKRSSIVLESPEWEDTITDNSDPEDISSLYYPKWHLLESIQTQAKHLLPVVTFNRWKSYY